jgi:hypothetical protein
MEEEHDLYVSLRTDLKICDFGAVLWKIVWICKKKQLAVDVAAPSKQTLRIKKTGNGR